VRLDDFYAFQGQNGSPSANDSSPGISAKLPVPDDAVKPWNRRETGSGADEV